MPETQVLKIPELSLVLLIGASGSGKSSFGRRHFLPTEVISSDFCRGLVADNENDQSATGDAFDLVYAIAAKRLAAGRLTVIDATHVQAGSRTRALQLAKQFHVLPVAIVLKMPERLCQDRNAQRPDRQFGPHVVSRQTQDLRRTLKLLKQEGFRSVFTLESPEQVEQVQIERVRLWTDRRDEEGPFDIIGDVHGCGDELEALLGLLGYQADAEAAYRHPEGRKVVFLGDLVDRGPRIVDCLNLAMRMTQAGTALCVPGNHESKFLRWLRGKNVKPIHGFQETLDQVQALPEPEQADFKRRAESFIDGLISHFVLDQGRLVVAHAGMRSELQGRASGRVREFALYGETTGETDEFGLPVRYPWASEYRGAAKVVYGHTPVPEAEWLNGTICLDTGCVFGGKLTALRYPEQTLVQVPAAQVYCEPLRPLREIQTGVSAQQYDDRRLELSEITGKQILETRLKRQVIIQAENAAAALEVLSRYSVDPRWLIYLPPTMSPSETSSEPDYLEHPREALGYYRAQGLKRVICQEKHMGSRAVVVICRDLETAKRRFGVNVGTQGTCYTRTGRAFFSQPALEAAFLERVAATLSQGDWWQRFDSDWFCLDAELLPWSAKAQELIRQQYAALSSAAGAALGETLKTLAQAKKPELETLQARIQERALLAGAFREAWQPYCWPVHQLEDYKLAPFQILASEGRVYHDQTHLWQIETLAELAQLDPGLFRATAWKEVDFEAAGSIEAALDWWLELTAAGGEGMVVKPLEAIARGSKGYVQPGVKCRGREYLRMIYSPEYTRPEHLKRLKKRGLAAKRSLALREFALGMEALERFVAKAPLREVHRCVAGLLALESEPVDPRL
ncbi:polynucleotide kinase-phosphatase [bacterium (Candidatus Blackallbacteria) CG17_big_fil_post_rev_8_21_14_2_50_48_46]|uniref:Polynucleotide kinase-phosphatase n=1 Tax=bacterium (Candidatus Blackallbacteria) CG17_big_fil_post_rev_8_21_14_2_50_48_46 TaxID=2014261 RepID=A0A2M7FXG6_9BACT|nr:MAG: polynucleotide kinase-phosphatase [bacterium (Candidatus Blackallbacteria) CG18_big_fil_WC_8_21_14_2_50_49_26]PIW13941.1 MAG: polynucleotide kinase-phosphatase [bacterium (Candidatus Blackallbacteria) CG17_big_fil_post_rev_8_21_14_2_50_48_46]PIW46792.1 MAG: polynucleotide kinase-phosphatase [bacterium (Candidatus Blackallbacteria) CG13_big_fil_rev_8_21_14_2_50_49_14]